MTMNAKQRVLGLDIGGTYLRAGLVDEQGTLFDFEMTSSAAMFTLDRGNRMDGLAAYIRSYCDRHLQGKPPLAVSIGFPSTLNKDKTVLLSTPNLPGLDNLPVVALLEDALGVPVQINRDVNLLMLHDIHEHGIPTEGVVISCYFGTGLGNAIAINGYILSGKNGVAGELGHIPVLHGDRRCGCGNVGCVETLAAGQYLTELAEKHFPGENINTLFAHHGDAPELRQFVEILSLPVATEINILDPNCVILGGGVLQMPSFPLPLLEKYILAHTRKPFPCEGLRIVYARPSQASGVIGAGMYGFQQMNRSMSGGGMDDDRACV